MQSSFLLFLVLATAAASASNVDLLEFDPPLLRLHDDRTQPTNIRVRLRQLPRAPTSLYFESPNLRFSICNLRFSPRTYNEWQPIEIRGMPYFLDGHQDVKELMSMRMSCPQGGEGWHGRNWTVPVERSNSLGGTCKSNGDPHITTFDGKYYSYQGLGCFYMLQSPYMTIQTMTDTWGSATVSVATAIRYGRAHFIVDSRATDPGKRLTQLSETAPGVDVIIGQSREEFRFKFSDGSEVIINHHGGNPRSYLDHVINVPNHYRSKTRGWCGTFNGNQADDWTGPNGDVMSDMNKCGDSWKVPATDDMFVCKDQCPDAKKSLGSHEVIKPCDMCRIPTNLEGHGIYRDSDPVYARWNGGQSEYAREKPSYDGKPLHLIPTPRMDTGFRQRAKAACEAAFNLPDLHKIVPTTPYLNACVSDCEITGTLEMVDAKKSAYLTECHSHINPILATTSYTGHAPNQALVPIVQQCQKAAALLGLGKMRCPRDCSGHGVCRKCGCKCRAGWTGPACDKRLDAYGIPVVSGGRKAQESVYGPPMHQNDRFDEEVDVVGPRPTFGNGGVRRPVMRQPRLADDRDFTPQPPMFIEHGRTPVGAVQRMNAPTEVLEDDGDVTQHGGPSGDADPFLLNEE